jgi:hypothetical protein
MPFSLENAAFTDDGVASGKRSLRLSTSVHCLKSHKIYVLFNVLRVVFTAIKNKTDSEQ